MNGGGVTGVSRKRPPGHGFEHGLAWEHEGISAKAIVGSVRGHGERNRAFRGGVRAPSSGELERGEETRGRGKSGLWRASPRREAPRSLEGGQGAMEQRRGGELTSSAMAALELGFEAKSGGYGSKGAQGATTVALYRGGDRASMCGPRKAAAERAVPGLCSSPAPAWGGRDA